MPLLTLLGQAAVGTDVSVNAGSLVITTFPATVSLDRDVAVNAGSLVLTPNAATVSLDRDISANAGSLVITPQPATITKATTISVNAGSIVLTPFAATIQAGDAVEAISYGGFLPELVERKLRKKDQDVLNDVIELVNKAEEIPLPQNIVKQVKQVEKKAEKTFKIQPIRIRNRELIETKERLIKVEGLVNRYVKELQDDEEEAIKALLEVI